MKVRNCLKACKAGQKYISLIRIQAMNLSVKIRSRQSLIMAMSL